MTHAQNEQSTDKKQNLARFFLEQKHIAWVALAVALLWGIYGLLKYASTERPGHSRTSGDDYCAVAGNIDRTSRATGHQED